MPGIALNEAETTQESGRSRCESAAPNNPREREGTRSITLQAYFPEGADLVVEMITVEAILATGVTAAASTINQGVAPRGRETVDTYFAGSGTWRAHTNIGMMAA
ncbi:hypothetical protein [Bradyrhizobium sp. 172]|uniref:hypothetical protein n=1 Tax=Bradyrhizobium sp. 172 TaxID=2782643 RepID=UPI001FFFA5B6|nr:hypothetical protein [Bradyrhizobium sp. 172]